MLASPHVTAAIIILGFGAAIVLMLLWVKFCAWVSNYSNWGLVLCLSPVFIFFYFYLVAVLS